MAKAISNDSNKKWIDVHRDIIFKYNITWHRAINTTPMKAFRGRTGINVEFSSKTTSIIENNLICGFQDNFNTSNSIKPLDEDYRRKYINKMVADADVHYNSINFNPGDVVLVAKSFDTNQKTKKEKLGGFYEDDMWIIVEKKGTDNFLIKSKLDFSKTMVISKNRMKKCINII